jgi:phage shock protein E
MKKLLLFTLLIPLLFIVSCGSGYHVITPQEGKAMLDNDSSIVLVDVRTASEYNEEHIPHAILLPVDEIESRADKVIPDQSATYIIYCRSGNRSAQASQILSDLGYKNIYDMGGIIDWPYDTVT